MAYNADHLVLMNYVPFNAAYPKVWMYSSTDSDATVLAAGYISDGVKKGMKVGDFVINCKTDTPAIYLHVVTVVGATTTTLGSTLLTMS